MNSYDQDGANLDQSFDITNHDPRAMELLGEELMAAIADAEQMLPEGKTSNSAADSSSSGAAKNNFDAGGTFFSSTAMNPAAAAAYNNQNAGAT